MTNIEKLAYECGFDLRKDEGGKSKFVCDLDDIEQLAKVVKEIAAAEERDACLAACIDVHEQEVSASSEYRVGRQMGAEVCFRNISARG